MNQEDIQKISKLLAKSEITPELSAYWEERYVDLLTKGMFEISDKTKKQILQTESIESPATPFGSISIIKHLDSNKNLNETLLQGNIETAVRLLDSCLEVISFSQSAREIIYQYRKIGLSLKDYEEYLKQKKKSSQIKEIDYLGSLVSSFCYRASESLAEEKGYCLSWEKINKHLRPKPFEYWANPITGEVKNGLELSEEFSQEIMQTSDFEIVPRRNSNILLLPSDAEWQIWSDRDESSAPTPIDKKSIGKIPAKPELKTAEIPSLTSAEKEESSPDIILEKPTNQFQFGNLGLDNTANPTYQIGELVTVKNPQDTEHNKIYQVIDIVTHPDRSLFRYRLTGGEEKLKNRLWSENEIKPADLSHILARLNDTDNYNVSLFLNALIVNEKNQFLAEKVENKFILPGDKMDKAKDLKESLLQILTDNYNLVARKFLDVFAVQEIRPSSGETDLHLAYYTILDDDKIQDNPNLTWLSFGELNKMYSTDGALVREYLDFVDRLNQSAEEIAEEKVKEKLNEELAILPTEEEIEQRIEKEIAFRLQEQNLQLSKNQEETESLKSRMQAEFDQQLESAKAKTSSQSQATIESLQLELEQAKQKIEEISSQLEEAKKAIDGLKLQAETSKNKEQAAKEELEKVKSEYEQRMKKLLANQLGSQQGSEQESEIIDNLVAETEGRYNAKIEIKENKIAELETEISKLKSRLKKSNAVTKENTDQSQKITHLEAQLARVKEQLREARYQSANQNEKDAEARIQREVDRRTKEERSRIDKEIAEKLALKQSEIERKIRLENESKIRAEVAKRMRQNQQAVKPNSGVSQQISMLKMMRDHNNKK